jgi:hypothetical protein
MKKHILSLFDPAHRWWTLSLFLASVLLILAANFVGINDNLPGIVILYSGIIFLFFTLLHPWTKWKNYAILIAICIGIMFLEWLGIHILDSLNKTEHISEAVTMIIAFFICLPGIMAGIIGIIICTVIKK